MIDLSLAQIAHILNTSVKKDCRIRGISRDTRHILPGSLFIAIKGEQFDGHDFVAEAGQKGAAAALVNRPLSIDLPQIIVPDTLAALGTLSAFWRNQFEIPVIGVTGSNGKTTLKNMIGSILRAASHEDAVLVTEGNLNNNIGLPLMMLRLNDKHRYAVLEMGMNHFNEIAYLTHLARPNIAVINNAAESHLEGLKSVAGVAQAKGEIFQGLSDQGIAILNKDDPHFTYWKDLVGSKTIITFGLNNPADVYADITDQNTTIHTPKGSFPITLPLLGRHNVMNALAATAVTLAANIDLAAIKKGLETVKPEPGRMRQFQLPNGARVIDDTYNANPTSLLAAAKTLATFQGKTIIVLGDMKELGDNTKAMHFDAGVKLKELGIQFLFTLGTLSAETQCGYAQNEALHFTDRESLIQALTPHLTPDAIILIKGSRSMKMEKIVESLVPEKKLEHAH